MAKTQKTLCPYCNEKKKVIKTFGRMTRLECRHLIKTPLSFEEVEEAETKKAEDIAADTTVSIKVVDETKFHNLKTKDTPYPFQLEGIDFIIRNGYRGLIADEQGLGKTVQALGIMHHALKNNPDDFFPCLLLVKSNSKIQWMVQGLNWGGYDFIPQVIEDSKSPPIHGFNVYISSYDILRRFSKSQDVVLKSAWGHEIETTETKNPFYDFPFKTIIMDEVQAIKGESKRTEEVKKIAQGKNVIALSGTPIKNNAAEYYTILHLLNPNKFPTRKGYISRWVKTEIVKGYEKYTGLWNPERFAQYTSDMIIRRTREDVKDEIGMRVTKANRIFYHVDFESDKLKKEYEREEKAFIKEMLDNTKKKSPVEMIARLSVMRHLVGLNKIQPTVDLAVEYLLENPSGKLVIFAHHQDVMAAITELLKRWCIEGGYAEPLVYHSGLSSSERYEMIDKFTHKDSSPFIIGSTLAMGEAVDRLQEVCNDCILAERQWNPANEEQAESRLIRIGQKRSFVNATYPIASSTIDEYFTEIVEIKRRAMKETLDGKSSYEWDEENLLTALTEAILNKGKKK